MAAAFMTWRRRAFGPYRQLTASCEHFEYDYLYFGPPPRDVLEFAVHRLPRKSASELRRLLAPIDRHFLERTLPNPLAPPGPWWKRRCSTDILN
ncbi:hypothetical protein [Glycomyces arizonensis]|uniref:hypothetical protein n=1 Tax=Glycomyces arizonensis TaxID=256035 RepID=UPI000423DEF6|nr:hypothetical protein [Glycomyces arizonensis]